MRTECNKYQEYMTYGENMTSNHRVYKFPNGWGASFICGFGSYGLELMPICSDETGNYSGSYVKNPHTKRRILFQNNLRYFFIQTKIPLLNYFL